MRARVPTVASTSRGVVIVIVGLARGVPVEPVTPVDTQIA
jgi:hypothetical protein